jgi:tRNA nucleotidyltransferase/poly(A) polymerase
MAEGADNVTATEILRALREAGYEAYFAGGCVRDMLLGQRPADYDIATSAKPEDIRRHFKRVLMVGAKFGVAIVLQRDSKGIDRQVEVATFRSDASYSDGRRPDAVTFSCPEEDAKRRDFTINGMFYDPLAEEVIDFVGGQADLDAGIVRTIGNPDERFGEDYLRLLRAVRFAVRLGFDIEPQTAQAARRHAQCITGVSGERILDELTKMLARDSAAEALRGLADLGLAEHVLPELADTDAWTAAVDRVERLAEHRDATLALGGLLCDLPRGTISRIVRRWGGSNSLKQALTFLAEHRDAWQAAAEMPLCDFKRLMASEHWPRLLHLWTVREARQTDEPLQTQRIATRAAAIPEGQISPEPLVTGADLMEMGLTEGKALGDILRSLYDAQLNEDLTTRPEALDAAREEIAARDGGA